MILSKEKKEKDTLTAAKCSHKLNNGVVISWGVTVVAVDMAEASQIFNVLSLPPLANNLPSWDHCSPQISCE